MKTLTLPLKKKWFDLIKAGIKKEENRETIKVIAHHKHKRCVAMADYCSYKAWYFKYKGEEEKFYRWMKFRLVWRELAKQFKEEK